MLTSPLTFVVLTVLTLARLATAGTAVPKERDVVWDFATASAAPDAAWPAGWSRGDPKAVSIATDAGRSFLRVRSARAQDAVVIAKLPVDPDWTTVTIRARARDRKRGAESWQTARVETLFYDGDGQRVGGWPPAMNLTMPTTAPTSNAATTRTGTSDGEHRAALRHVERFARTRRQSHRVIS